MWNTGVNAVANLLDVGINIVDAEDKGYTLTVPSKKVADFKSVILPWCDSEQEVKDKAFRVYSLDSGDIFMYLYQWFDSDTAYWAVDLDRPFNNGRKVQRGSDPNSGPLDKYSAINLYILPTHVFGTDSVNENNTVERILSGIERALDDVEKVVEIAAAGAGAAAGGG